MTSFRRLLLEWHPDKNEGRKQVAEANAIAETNKLAWNVLAAVTHSSGQTWSGPQPHALGLQRWANVWGSGDYVGRWLWSANDGTSPAPLQVDDARYGGAVHEGQDAAGRLARVSAP